MRFRVTVIVEWEHRCNCCYCKLPQGNSDSAILYLDGEDAAEIEEIEDDDLLNMAFVDLPGDEERLTITRKIEEVPLIPLGPEDMVFP